MKNEKVAVDPMDSFSKPEGLPTSGESNVYDRYLSVSVPGIAEEGARFRLDVGFYTNEDETIVCKSTSETGKYFKKYKDSGDGK